jgi:HK97 gp10 family phage protein
MAKITVTGINEIKDALFKLNYRVGEKIVRASLKKGAAITAKTIRRTAPKEDNRLSRSVSIRSSKFAKFKTRGSVGVYVLVGGGKRPQKGEQPGRRAWYARSVEYGYTARGRKGSKNTTGKSSRVPGQGFIAEGFNLSKSAATDTINDSMSRAFVHAAKELGLDVRAG